MAIIGKIREKSVLVLVLVGLSLVLFILGDFLTNNRGGTRENYIGEIFGEPIDAIEYERRVAEAIDRENQNRQMQGLPSDPSMNDQIREQIWEQYITELVSQREVDHFNFEIGTEELNDMVMGENIHPWLRSERSFQDMFGQFSADSVKKYINFIQSSNEPQVLEARRAWRQFEIGMKKSRTGMKYNNLISKGVYVTTEEAKKNFEEDNKIYHVRFVVKKYMEIPDSMVQVTDEDIKAYYEKNKFRKQYEQPGSRVVEYIEFPIVPSQADKEKVRNDLSELKDDFQDAANDSLFVMQYAENPNFSDRYSSANEFPKDIDSLLQNSDSGAVVGPYEQMGYYKLMKVRGVKYEPEAKVRHILLGKEKGTIEELKKRADSIRTVIRKNNNFEEMAMKYSDDPGKFQNAGFYDWFPKGMMVKNFEDASFNSKVGDWKIVETEFGVHLVEVLGQRQAKRVKYAVIDMKIRPFKETENEVKMAANDFLTEVGTDTSKFRPTAQKMMLNVLSNEIFKNQRTMNNDESSREFVRWAYTAAEGDVSDVITMGDKIVIGRLMNIKQKGVPEFEDVREIMAIKARQEKKAEMLEKQLSGAKNIEDAAAKIGAPVLTAELKFSSTTIRGGGGNEPQVIGTVFSLRESQKGAMTVPIKGSVGVYVIVLDNITVANQSTDYSTQKNNMILNLSSRSGSDALRALKENANVVDERTFQ